MYYEYSVRPGVIFLDKPVGILSTKLDNYCKKLFQTKKVGHIGTLDPFASGILPLALNGATKLIPYFVWTQEKTYEFEIKFGEKTDTADKTGKIIEISNIIPTSEVINSVLLKFTGKIMQVPPKYSAVKIQGRNAYELARKGENFEIRAKEIEIKYLELLNQVSANIFKFKAVVSSGTYIRSLAEDLARATNSVGHVVSLRRLAVGHFSNGIKPEELNVNNANLFVYPIDKLLENIPFITITDDEANCVRLGKIIELENISNTNLICVRSPAGFIGILEFIENNLWKPRRMICDVLATN